MTARHTSVPLCSYLAGSAALLLLALAAGCPSGDVPLDADGNPIFSGGIWNNGDRASGSDDEPLVVDTDGDGIPDAPAGTGPGGLSGTGGGGTSTAGGGTSVVAGGSPNMRIAPATLDFGTDQTQQSITLRNIGGGALAYVIEANVDWVQFTPASGNSAGEEDIVLVTVNRAGLSSGTHTGTLSVLVGDGNTANIVLSAAVPGGGDTNTNDNNTNDNTGGTTDPPPPPPTPQLSVSATSLDFADMAQTLTFIVANAGAGTLNYSVTTEAPWLEIQNGSGSLTTAPATITVRAYRSALYTGEHAATLNVGGTGSAPVTVNVSLRKPLTSPKIIPWLELNTPTPENIEVCVAGMAQWRRVTDEFIITAPGTRPDVYNELRARVPGARLIASLKTSGYTIPAGGFERSAAWAAIANHVAQAVQIGGIDAVLFENETATMPYYQGQGTIDLEVMKSSLALLPSDVQYIWYPSVATSTDPNAVQRSLVFCEAVDQVLHPRFVDLSFGDPAWPSYPPCTIARGLIDSHFTQPSLPIIYFGRWSLTDFWKYADADVALNQMAGRPSATFYPGFSRWIEAGTAISDELWPPGQ